MSADDLDFTASLATRFGPIPGDDGDYGVERAPATQAPAAAFRLNVVNAASFAGLDVPERAWLVRDMIPARAVTILAGDGGVGKSLLALQLAAAVATGRDWIGTMPEAGAAVLLSAEDDSDELHRRLANIANGQGFELAELNKLQIVSLAGQDAVLGAPHPKSGIIAGTPLLEALRAYLAAIRPRLLVLDNHADVFAGNENARAEARQFVGILQGLAIEFDAAVLLLSHPSLSGMSSGAGTSGSTAWSNSVRSRLYLERRRADDGQEPEPDLRVLRTKKSNYARDGGEIELRWLAGRFTLDNHVGGFDKIAADAKADRLFLDLLARFEREGRDVSAKASPTYAPKLFAQQPDAAGMTAKVISQAMQRLFVAKRIAVETSGPPSRRRSRIVLAIEEPNA